MNRGAERAQGGAERQPQPERDSPEVNYLNPADPIDACLIDYRTAINKDTVPTMAQQRVMIAGLRSGQSTALTEFVDNHMGIVAAVAYPYKGAGLTSEDLLQAGIQALIRAGQEYVRADSIDFSDFAADAVNGELASLLPDKARGSYVGSSGYPMQDIYQFMQTVEVQEIPPEETVPAEDAPAAEAEITAAPAEEPDKIPAGQAVDADSADTSEVDEAASEPEIPAEPIDEMPADVPAEAAPDDAADAADETAGVDPEDDAPVDNDVPAEPEEAAPKRKLTLEEQFAEKCGFVEDADMGEYDREAALSHMKPKEREANELYFFSGSSRDWQAVGEILGISKIAAYGRGRRGWEQARNGIRKARRAAN
jgi:hypothetical protein